MSFKADLEQFFESEQIDYDYKFSYDVENLVRIDYLKYIKLLNKANNNFEYHKFLCWKIESEIKKGLVLYGDLEPEWEWLCYYYKVEAEKERDFSSYEPFRLWVLLDFILQLSE